MFPIGGGRSGLHVAHRLFGQAGESAAQRFEVDVALGMEVEIDSALGHSRRFGDLVHRGVFEAFARGFQDLSATEFADYVALIFL
jgi:hypothetical protein